MIRYRTTLDGLTPTNLDGFVVGWLVRPSAGRRAGCAAAGDARRVAKRQPQPDTADHRPPRSTFDRVSGAAELRTAANSCDTINFWARPATDGADPGR